MPSNRSTLHDVAQRAGVSKSTVSRVLNDHPHAGDEARVAVLRAIDELDYRRNEVARSLRMNTTMTVGLIVTALRNEVFAAIAHGVETSLAASGRTLLVATSNDDLQLERNAVLEFIRRGADGIIMSLVSENSKEVRGLLASANVPIVLLDRDAPGISADRVLTNHRAGVVEAVRDLQKHGHQRIGLLCLPATVRVGREVRESFLSVVRDDRFIRLGRLSEEFGYDAMQDLMGASTAPTAVVVSGTQVLIGVLTALRELNISIPNDLSLVSYDDAALARFHTPQISALIRDTEKIGRLAANLITERIDGRRSQLRKVIVTTHYVPRDSVASPRRQP